MHVTRSPVTKKSENFELSHQKEKDLVHFFASVGERQLHRVTHKEFIASKET